MSINGIGQNELIKYAAMQQAKINAAKVSAQAGAGIGAGAAPVSQIDVNAINELARKNAVEKTEKTERTAAAASYYNPVQSAQVQPSVEKVDANTVKEKFGAQPVFASANKYKGTMAGDAYAKNSANLNKSEFGQYDGLKNFKTKEVSASNPFAAALSNNGSSVTSGLSFMGINNPDVKKNMFIA